MFRFRGTITDKDASGFYGVQIPDLGIFTQGKTIKGCYDMAKEAIELALNCDIFIDGKNKEFYIWSDEPKKLIGRFLQNSRSEAGLSLAEVVEKLGYKSRNSYAQYEQGRTMPSAEKLSELIEAMNPSSFLVVSKSQKSA
jgi:predicted RNase H-like HicB family nuclease